MSDLYLFVFLRCDTYVSFLRGTRQLSAIKGEFRLTCKTVARDFGSVSPHGIRVSIQVESRIEHTRLFCACQLDFRYESLITLDNS